MWAIDSLIALESVNRDCYVTNVGFVYWKTIVTFSMGFLPIPSYKLVFNYVKYWGLCYNWSIRNGLIISIEYDNMHIGVKENWFDSFHNQDPRASLSSEELTLCRSV